MELLAIKSGYLDPNFEGVVHLTIEVDEDGERNLIDFVLHPDDSFGLSSSVRNMLKENPIQFDAPPDVNMDALKRLTKLDVVSFADELGQQIKTSHRDGVPFPQDEEKAWHEKTPEAREILTIPEETPLDVSKYPILNTLFDGNETAMRTEAIKIVFFADRFKKAAALIQKIREETEKAIDACNSPEEIQQVLETAKASAQGAMETL